MNAHQGFDPQGAQFHVARKKQSVQPFHPTPYLTADGFDIWWNRTLAQNSAVVAQASARLRADRPVSSAVGAQAGPAHLTLTTRRGDRHA